jgi:predicted ATPase with chaperone activity
MMGPPGAGKTLLARALPGILPKVSIDGALVGAGLFQCQKDTCSRLEE